tara:strand:+ start:498 stop:659 length:162 start_codon:yes stop_codon:yes gene_type:complete
MESIIVDVADRKLAPQYIAIALDSKCRTHKVASLVAAQAVALAVYDRIFRFTM